MPHHLIIIFADYVFRIGKTRIMRKYRVTAQENEISILPEYPYGYRVDNPFDDLKRCTQCFLRSLALGYVHIDLGHKPFSLIILEWYSSNLYRTRIFL